MSNEVFSDLNAVVVQSEGYLVSDMNGEKVMLSIENGKYYNLGQIGGRIWELINTPVTIRDVVKQLLEEYEIDQETCTRQVFAFLHQLAGEGLVQASKTA
ncbi:lasso peptide biosynthesis PqqD family chaperone [Paenibacillus thailandensis]|uniref:Lasso peptide biosynthesis PqqD family chaperone n=1 Tax=Paenibacillus thailandensis TaxID=393250 RepID=A0ABW5R2Z4_9BACL